jgi:hypothetical protein
MNDYISKSGVKISADFRDNLIIDRYDPVFSSMRMSKRKHLRSANSEDALTWNVFRSLRQINPTIWLNDLFSSAFPGAQLTHTENATVELWKSVEPPPGLLLDADEGDSEIDVVIETPSAVWFIEAKLTSDISTGTTTRVTRDQVLRNIDVGSYYAGTRDYYFSLLIADATRSKEGVRVVDEYRNLDEPRQLLRNHRPDGLKNLRGVSRLTWANLAEILDDAAQDASLEAERQYASRALHWMRERKLAHDVR